MGSSAELEGLVLDEILFALRDGSANPSAFPSLFMRSAAASNTLLELPVSLPFRVFSVSTIFQAPFFIFPIVIDKSCAGRFSAASNLTREEGLLPAVDP